ncbi:MAG: hypothetical protein ACOC0O_03885 [Spirochaetota bacterium]
MAIDLPDAQVVAARYAEDVQTFVRREVDALSPDDRDVLIGLARTQFELERYEEARESFELASVIAPVRTEPFNYIVGGGTDTARASNAQRRTIMNWSE